jgi:hypothetical protein
VQKLGQEGGAGGGGGEGGKYEVHGPPTARHERPVVGARCITAAPYAVDKPALGAQTHASTQTCTGPRADNPRRHVRGCACAQ